MDMQQIVDSARTIASDSQDIDIRSRTAIEMKRNIASRMANDTPLAVLKSLLMIGFTAFPDPDEITGHADSGEIASIDFMIKILANIEECVEMISLRLATDSIDRKYLHNFFSPLRLLDCRFLRCPLPQIERYWSASSLAIEKIYSLLTSANTAIANVASIDLSSLLTAN